MLAWATRVRTHGALVGLELRKNKDAHVGVLFLAFSNVVLLSGSLDIIPPAFHVC